MATDTVVVSSIAHGVVVAPGAQGPQGPQGPIGPSGGSAISVVAAVNVGGNRMVLLDESERAIYADNTVPSHVGRVLGITIGAAAEGDAVDVLRQGDIVEPSWSWTVGSPVFLAQSGLLTQTAPVSGFLLVVGFPITPTRLFVSFREPIMLT